MWTASPTSKYSDMKYPSSTASRFARKKMLYYLGQAAQMGRDIIWDQNGRHNLQIRQLLENVYTGYKGDRESAEFKAFEKYLKQVWFGNGIHHHYSTDKYAPGFSQSFLEAQVNALPAYKLPLAPGETKAEMMATLMPVIFDPAVMPKRVNQTARRMWWPLPPPIFTVPALRRLKSRHSTTP